MIKITTNKGEFTIEMFSEKAPQTTENFEQYVKDGYYDGTIFHRVINNFMIQGGGFESGMTQKKTRDTIDNEANNGISNEVGTVAMARTNDPHSASSQFFINVKDNNFLDHTSLTTNGWGYCVFGKIVDGMDVINEMKAVETGTDTGHADVPVEEIVIIKAEVIED